MLRQYELVEFDLKLDPQTIATVLLRQATLRGSKKDGSETLSLSSWVALRTAFIPQSLGL